MPFNTYERSTYSGQPIQLYEFYRKSGDIDIYWRYNSSDRNLTYLGYQYGAVAISNEGVKLSGEASSTEFKVTMPISAAFATDFRLGGAVPSDTVYLTVFSCHAGDIIDIDTDPAPTVFDARVTWKGTVDGLTQIDDLQVSVTCSMLATSFKRGGLRQSWVRYCPHVLYDPLTCKADKELFRADTFVASLTGNALTSDDFLLFDDGWFNGGYVQYALSSGATERRLVLSHVGSVLKVLGPLGGLAVGDVVTVYAGCAHNTDACINKFNNFLNYGGFPQMPGRNPFDGNPVFK